jgi:adenylate kinase family enzyme
MVNHHSIQTAFLEQVKKKLPTTTSIADELAEILNISRDSAYRRIRGETVLSLDEAKLLCNHFSVSLDAFMGTASDIIPFHHLVVNHTPQTFERWLANMLSNLELIAGYKGKKELVFTAKDVPVFHYFNYPELSAFKMFFWMKSVLNYSSLQHEKFSTSLIPKEYLTLGKRIWNTYSKTPSTEVWSDETTNVTLRQIEFYSESGFFHSTDEALKIFDQYQEMIRDIREQAASGHKQNNIQFTLYKNEILIADNTIFFRLDDKRITYISHNITELLMTTQQEFCKQTEQFINNLQNRSILISTTGEKERNKFFNRIEEKIENTKKRLAIPA